MNVYSMNHWFWIAHARVTREAQLRYNAWSLGEYADDGYYQRRWDWAMSDDDYGVQLMALILERK